MASTVFLVVAGLGAAISYLKTPPKAPDSTGSISFLPGEPRDAPLQPLADYARSLGTTEEAPPPIEHSGTVRAMVEGLANRLERAPRDVEGWTLLMRSRVVLGERDMAKTAFRKALEIFKDDPAASGEITAAAAELGLTAE